MRSVPMRFFLPWLLLTLTLLTATGCPLDIQVREEADGGCTGSACTRSCASDRDCPDGQRCNELDDQCEPGPRLTEPCSDSFSCSTFARCLGGRCSQACAGNCPAQYQCAPDGPCVESCDGLPPPATLGDYCASSLECGRCGFCVDLGGGKQCHQPCRADDDCPGGASGACAAISGSSLRACRRP
ncbi:latent transforming growth factor beta-binding protein [Corallococcus sp. CA047B]|uniref:latent transforming growth factor beta-binding protein n=1 Tax=Corallococcus sp. CA047B TaxID=2316729 RepID=UPI001F200869|nr:latent transforming growth factor beta-binding protein [Corallococcus sp. CA047B]